MGLALFTLALVVEVGLVLFSIRTRSSQRRVRTVARLALLVAFLLAVSIGLIEWGPVYYALAAVLAVAALLAIAFQVRAKTARFRTARTIWAGAAMVWLMLLASLPPILFPGYEPLPTTGEWPVSSAVRTFTDLSRADPVAETGEARRLTVGFWYPSDATGPAPLIVFSHGGTGVRSSNESMFNELASHGYVVASIDHTYHSLYTVDEDGSRTWIDREFLGEIRNEDASSDPVGSLDLYRKWLAVRTDDFDFVIEQVRSGEVATLDGRVDPGLIGVMGHSLGGSAALAVGRRRSDIGAVIALESPFLGDIEAASDGGFVWTTDPYPVPVLNVYSDSAWGNLGEWPQYAQNANLLDSPDPAVLDLHIEGVGHFGLTDLALTSPILTRMLDGPSTGDSRAALTRLNRVAVEFFDAHLKTEPAASTAAEARRPKAGPGARGVRPGGWEQAAGR